jgi:hypothetical protein
MLAEQAFDEDKNVSVNLDNEYMKSLVESYERKQADKQQKSRSRRRGVEKFYDE